jgi:hypothetical protein
MTRRSGWSLNHLVVLLLAGAFTQLLIEVRYFHHEVLREHAIAWAPIAYSALMLVAIAIAAPFWDRGGRRALFWALAPAPVIGPVGYWFHNDGRPLQGLENELAAWARPIGLPEVEGRHQEATAGPARGDRSGHEPRAAEESRGTDPHRGEEAAHDDEGGPPALAPLAIAGLGLLGMLACARRFQPEHTGSRVE